MEPSEGIGPLRLGIILNGEQKLQPCLSSLFSKDVIFCLEDEAVYFSFWFCLIFKDNHIERFRW